MVPSLRARDVPLRILVPDETRLARLVIILGGLALIDGRLFRR